ncbi:MAG: flavodoxin family protein [Actinobacteria bacterium]|nr:flavodoxin family protein [Actinomycetota bacterium]
MKITVFNGSHRGKNGNTHVMVEEFLYGARDVGAEVENIFLIKKEIKPCLSCFTCWVKTPGKCIIKDDMKDLLSKFMSSDIVVFATPIYVDNITGIMKIFIDRLIPLIDPHYERDEEGECRHTKRFEKYPKFVVISNCGYPEQSHFQVLSLLFKRIARNIHSEVIAEIYRGGGWLYKTSLISDPLFCKYKELLREAGEEIVKNLKLSKKTISKLKEPIISVDEFIEFANRGCDKLLSRIKI